MHANHYPSASYKHNYKIYMYMPMRKNITATRVSKSYSITSVYVVDFLKGIYEMEKSPY